MIHHADDWLTIHGGDARDVLPTLPDESVDCIVTSPPYWGLRDYGNEGQFGLEATPEECVANLVGVFRELRRVLKPSGTCWLNLGDSFNAKQLVGIPWRVAFALQADGWWLRSDIIWAKPNPMPESVTDRPTKAHEYLFLLTKAERYYFDQEAVREPHRTFEERDGELVHTTGGNGRKGSGWTWEGRGIAGAHPNGRNLRSVWTIATRPYPGAHFAVFPPELPERCIKAGSSERGVCPECGAPWRRVVEQTRLDYGMGEADTTNHKAVLVNQDGRVALRSPTGHTLSKTDTRTVGWIPSCAHDLHPVGAVVLDPFAGSGTVGLVANRLSRKAILIDLNPAYLEQQMRRNAQVPAGL